MGIYLDQLTQDELLIVQNLMEIPDDKIKPDYRREDLTDRDYGSWKVLKYAGKKKWICKCSCGEIRSIAGTELKSGRSQSCGHSKRAESLIGKRFGYLEVIERIDGRYHKCICHCGCGGTEKIVGTYDLKMGKVRSCGLHTTRKESIVGKRFNNWEVLEHIGSGQYKCICHCGCGGNTSVIYRRFLVNGHSKSCGYNKNMLIDLAGQKFGEWTVIEHIGLGRWLCRCSCEAQTEKIIRHTELLNGDSKSCGCKRSELYVNTMIDRYGETNILKLQTNPRSIEQIEAVRSRDSLLAFINKYCKEKPTVDDVSKLLGIKYANTLGYIHAYNLEDHVRFSSNSSKYEQQLVEYIRSLGVDESDIITGDRSILNGKELDIYIPSKRLAIEFNGNFWHSDIYKHKKYHQEKTIAAFRNNIQLIHIFEYEWVDERKRSIILNILKNKLSSTLGDIVYAKRCYVDDIGSQECSEFLNINHLQDSANAAIRLGLYFDDELIGVMTFGKSRFNTSYQYELIRLAWKSDIKVVGGAKKLFKYFICKYNPSSIISYCDISKFNGQVYFNLGFKPDKSEFITTPNYVWLNPLENKVIHRYHTQKHKLIEAGLGSPDMTESEIMESIGFIRVYDSGNAKFVWE